MLLLIAKRRHDDQTRVMSDRDLNELFVREPWLHYGLNINPETRSDLHSLIANPLPQRVVNTALIVGYREFRTQFVNDVNELQRQTQPLGYCSGRQGGLSRIP